MIGRIYSVGFKQVERFCLRLLLLLVKGTTSFDYLRLVNGVEYPTFREAAVARNLLKGNESWKRALMEAATFEMPGQLRQLFVDLTFLSITFFIYLRTFSEEDT